MKILIKNANLISMDENRDKYEKNIDILINNEFIEKIEKNINTQEDVKIIDATEKIVMPGLINTHSHIPMCIFRDTLDGYALKEWLEEKIWPMEDKLTGDDMYYAAYLACIEMAKTGCTMVNDMYFFPDQIIKAAKEVGVRIQVTRPLMSVSKDADERLNTLKDLISNHQSNDEISINAGIHGLYTTIEEDTIKFVNFAKENNLIVHMHFCEDSNEVEEIKNSYNVKSPIEVIKKYFTDVPTILAHCVKLTDDEIEELSKMKNISISHCPISNLKLGCGIAKIQKMLESGINVSLGTDGQGSGSNLDLFEAMKFTALLQKGIIEDPKVIPAYEVLKMATINGAKALGLENSIGSIKENKKADIIILDTDTPTMQPINDIFSDIVYNAKGSNVITTIINGKIVMENRNLKYTDEKFLYNKCKQIIQRIRE